MVDVDAARFMVRVFQDIAWATKGLGALTRAGFGPDMLTILAKDTPEAAALIEKTVGAAGERMDIAGIGTIVARGPLVEALQGSARDLAKLGLAGTMRRVGFQAHAAPMFDAPAGPRPLLLPTRTPPPS